ncbi:hypothetical protein CSE16_14230 [Solibacillus sp. R5-41]|uniref:hypothetical protein n=1 Tax=Solibacillus sp. R5-41 TaxID=2048654 RepID=UPI000C12507C|nr:hypothetical protein [Solibacillus sp. R5-41]ATP41116.1 hypothetical protein CSE16_14230 [Solibacillus sp. R5-41]
MNEPNVTKAGTNIDAVKKLNAASGLSYNDVKAMLAQASQVETADEIPLEELKANAAAESNNYRLNQATGSIHLKKDGLR